MYQKTNQRVVKLPRSSERGAILGVALIMVLVVSMVGVGLLNLLAASSFESVRRNQSMQNFWAAETGLSVATWYLKNSKEYRDSVPATLNGHVDTTTSYVYGVGMTLVSNNGTTTTYRAVSTGRTHVVANYDRTLSQYYDTSRQSLWTNFALHTGTNGGDIIMRQDVEISGTVMSGGSFNFGNQDAIVTNGLVYSQGTFYNEDPDDPIGDINLFDPIPEFPTLDTTYYHEKLAEAEGNDSGLTFTNNINLAGNTWYVEGTAHINTNVSIQIYSEPPGGTLIVTDNFRVFGETSIGANIDIIVGGLVDLKHDMSMGTNTLLYAGEGFTIKHGSYIATHSALISEGDIDAKHDIAFSGMMYAGGTVEFSQNASVTGIVLAASGADFGQTTRLTYSTDVLPKDPPGVPAHPDFVIDRIYHWEEL